jgi:hypothetical protein
MVYILKGLICMLSYVRGSTLQWSAGVRRREGKFVMTYVPKAVLDTYIFAAQETVGNGEEDSGSLFSA